MRLVLLAFAFFFLQGPPAQVTASLEGTVVRAGTSTPVIRALVTIGNARTMTDESGRFVMRNIQPGRYRVTATHNSYLPAQYGDRRRAAEITLMPGQVTRDVVIAMIAKGAISGRVYDRYGDPVTNATVQALKYVYQDGRRILVPLDNARTNDLGEYRLFWLAPGPYIISAAPPESPCADASCSMLIENRNATSGPAPVIGGTVRLDGRIAIPAPDSGETRLPVYYPGTTDASMASLIDLPPGINFTGVDLMITESRAVRVVGRVVNGVTGQSILRGSVMLVPRRGTIATGSTQRSAVSNMGAFEFRHMAPGSYELVATSSDAATGQVLAASASLEIAGRDIDGLTLVLQSQIAISGRIMVESAETGSGINLSGARVELRREPFTSELLTLLPTVSADGMFTIGGVTPGDHRLRVELRGFRAYVKSARLGGIDALNPPFRIDVPSQLEIVLSLNPASVDAVVFDDAQKPCSDATAVLVPDPPRRQRFDLYDSVKSDASGRVHFDSVAPGDYRLFAWDEVPADAWQDPDFLRLYEDRGRPIHLAEGSRESVEVRLIKSSP